jgi:hypothetical protein
LTLETYMRIPETIPSLPICGGCGARHVRATTDRGPLECERDPDDDAPDGWGEVEAFPPIVPPPPARVTPDADEIRAARITLREEDRGRAIPIWELGILSALVLRSVDLTQTGGGGRNLPLVPGGIALAIGWGATEAHASARAGIAARAIGRRIPLLRALRVEGVVGGPTRAVIVWGITRPSHPVRRSGPLAMLAMLGAVEIVP